MECAAFAAGNWVRDVPVDELRPILESEQGDDFVWVSLDEPDDALLESFREPLHLHELAIEDMEKAHQRSKLEDFDDSLYLVFRTGVWNEERSNVDFGETHVVAGRHHLLTAQHGATPHGTALRQRCEHAPLHVARGSMHAVHAIFDVIVDEWAPVVDKLDEVIETLEERLLAADVGADLVRDIYAARTVIMAVRRAVSPLLDVSDRLLAFTTSGRAPAELRPYFRDIHDHVVRLAGRIDDLRDLTAAAVQTHVSLVSLRQNDITRQLASWAAIIAVPTMVAGVFGMNFVNLPGLDSNAAMYGVGAGTLGACLGLYVAFRRAAWL